MYTEFISSEGLIRDAIKSKQKLDIYDYERPIGIQIFGGDEEALALCTKIVDTVNPDLIDINFGCPVKKVAMKGAGAGVLKDLDLMVRLTEAVVKSTNLPVTVKTRLGWDESSKNIREVAVRLQDVGIKALAIHGRTRMQMYKGEADWTLIGEVKNDPLVTIPIFGNGDINSPEKAVEYKNKYGVDGIMIGRAAIGYPWIFREIRNFIETGTRRADPTIEERVEVARKHLQKSLEWKGPIAGINEMRRHYANYLKGLPSIKDYRAKLVRITDPAEIEAVLDEIKEQYKGMVIESGKIVLENYHEHCPIN
jgi:nifR3 family TIM-barrel protein